MRHPLPMVAAMGTKNRQRRAAKARKRARQHERRRTEPRSGPTARPPTTVRQLLWLAATDRGPDSVAALDALTTADAALVCREAETLMLLAVGELWDNGWQPAEAVRLARRVDGRAGRLMSAAVAADHSRRDPSTLHPRWATQLESLDLPDVRSAMGWVAAFGRAELLHQVALGADDRRRARCCLRRRPAADDRPAARCCREHGRWSTTIQPSTTRSC